MIWGELGQKQEKKYQQLLARGKKTQLNNPEEKNSTAGWPGTKKLNSRLVGKKINANSRPEAPPQIINGPSLITSQFVLKGPSRQMTVHKYW